MPNDRLWKFIAIAFICSFFFGLYVYARINRYHSQGVRFVLDRWTGKTYSITELRKK